MGVNSEFRIQNSEFDLYNRLIVSVVYIALPIALLLALAGVAAFIWSVRSGQMDDLETPALRVLGEEDERRVSPPSSTAEDPPTDETSGGSKT